MFIWSRRALVLRALAELERLDPTVRCEKRRRGHFVVRMADYTIIDIVVSWRGIAVAHSLTEKTRRYGVEESMPLIATARRHLDTALSNAVRRKFRLTEVDDLD